VAGVVVLLLLQTKRPFALFKRLIGLSLASVLIFALLTAIVPPNTISALDDAIFAITNPLEAPTFLYRVQLWEEIMIPALQENPLWGYGTSSAGEGLGSLYAKTNSQHFASHNLYLKIFLELGIIGLFLFFVLVIGSLSRAFTSWRLARKYTIDPTIQITQFWGIATVIAFLVAGLAIPTLDAQPVSYYFWLLLGLISSREFTHKPFQSHQKNSLANSSANTVSA
jgi:O-antigen ligase